MIRLVGCFLCCGIVLATGGCTSNPPVAVPQYSAAGVAQEMLNQYDKDKDGQLDPAEAGTCPALKQSFASIDSNKNQRLEADELKRRLQEILDSNTGLMSVSCQVSRDGQPLQGATVRFIPEACFGDAIKGATGVSDAEGRVQLQVEGSGLAGYVPPGFFRIEVSLKDAAGQETISATYNTKTILGAEVGPRLRGTIQLHVR